MIVLKFCLEELSQVGTAGVFSVRLEINVDLPKGCDGVIGSNAVE